jgi:hypothetical protein
LPAEYFELPWKWLHPGVEPLLLAELVGLLVLERHQLFEPASEKVTRMEARMGEMLIPVSASELKTLASSITPFCLTGADGGQVRRRLLRRPEVRQEPFGFSPRLSSS